MDYLDIEIAHQEMAAHEKLTKVVKEKAWELLKHSNVLRESKLVDNYINNAIIIAYEFEKKWRNVWEKLQEEELKEEK